MGIRSVFKKLFNNDKEEVIEQNFEDKLKEELREPNIARLKSICPEILELDENEKVVDFISMQKQLVIRTNLNKYVANFDEDKKVFSKLQTFAEVERADKTVKIQMSFQDGKIIDIELPITKNQLYSYIDKEKFQKENHLIHNVQFLNFNFIDVDRVNDLKYFNLFAEKLRDCSDEELEKLQCFLRSEDEYLVKSLSVLKPIKLCNMLDNLDKYKIERVQAGSEIDANKEYIEGFGYLKCVDDLESFRNVDYLYKLYDIPEGEKLELDELVLNLKEFKDVGEYGEEFKITLPFKDEEMLEEINLGQSFQVNCIESKHDIFIGFLLDKDDIKQLNDFMKDYQGLHYDKKVEFQALYSCYSEVFEDVYSNGIPIKEYSNIVRKTDNYKFMDKKAFSSLVVGRYIQENGSNINAEELKDFDKLFDKIYNQSNKYDEVFYANDLYIINKKYYDKLFELKQVEEIQIVEETNQDLDENLNITMY